MPVKGINSWPHLETTCLWLQSQEVPKQKTDGASSDDLATGYMTFRRLNTLGNPSVDLQATAELFEKKNKWNFLNGKKLVPPFVYPDCYSLLTLNSTALKKKVLRGESEVFLSPRRI